MSKVTALKRIDEKIRNLEKENENVREIYTNKKTGKIKQQGNNMIAWTNCIIRYLEETKQIIKEEIKTI